MGMGDGATIGYLQAIETAQTGYLDSRIATIGDVTGMVTHPDTVPPRCSNYTDTYVQAIKDIENGSFGTKSYELTVANGGLSLQDTPALRPTPPRGRRDRGDQVGQGEGCLHRHQKPQTLIDAKGK